MPVTMPISAAGSGVEAVVEGLERAGDAEQRQPERVEDVDQPLHPAQRRVEGEGEQPGDDRDQQVAPVLERGRRGGADQHVAQEPAAETRRTGQDQHAEDVEALADGDQGAGDREHEDAEQVEHDQGGGRFGLHVSRRY